MFPSGTAMLGFGKPEPFPEPVTPPPPVHIPVCGCGMTDMFGRVVGPHTFSSSDFTATFSGWYTIPDWGVSDSGDVILHVPSNESSPEIGSVAGVDGSRAYIAFPVFASYLDYPTPPFGYSTPPFLDTFAIEIPHTTTLTYSVDLQCDWVGPGRASIDADGAFYPNWALSSNNRFSYSSGDVVSSNYAGFYVLLQYRYDIGTSTMRWWARLGTQRSSGAYDYAGIQEVWWDGSSLDLITVSVTATDTTITATFNNANDLTVTALDPMSFSHVAIDVKENGSWWSDGVTDYDHVSYYYVDNLNIAGLNLCTAPQFENFDRIDPSSWGTAVPGNKTWVLTTGAGATVSVDGRRGLITCDGSLGQTWAQQHISDASGPWASGQFLMKARFFVTDNGPLWKSDTFFNVQAGSNIASVELTDSGLDVGLYLTGFTNSASTTVTITKGWDYTLKWDYHYTDTHCRAKVWKDGEPEPDWQIDFDDTTVGDPCTAFWTRFYTISSYVATLGIDGIDFMYAGRPCYWSPPTTAYVVVDDFGNRSLGPSAPSGTLNWGNASGGGSWTQQSNSGMIEQVSGTGSFKADLTSVPTPDPHNPIMTYASQSLTGSPVAGVGYRFKFRVSSLGAAFSQNGFTWEPNRNFVVGSSAWVQVTVYEGPTAPNQRLYIHGGGDVGISISPATWYYLEYALVGGVLNARVYDASGAAPDWMIAGTDTVLPTMDLYAQTGFLASGDMWQIEFDTIEALTVVPPSPVYPV